MTLPLEAPSKSDVGRAPVPPASLGALVEALPFPVAIFDGGLELVAANQPYRELTGLAGAQLARRPLREAFPNALGDLTSQMDAAAAGRRATATRVAFRRGTGERLVDVTLAPLIDTPTTRGVVFAGA